MQAIVDWWRSLRPGSSSTDAVTARVTFDGNEFEILTPDDARALVKEGPTRPVVDCRGHPQRRDAREVTRDTLWELSQGAFTCAPLILAAVALTWGRSGGGVRWSIAASLWALAVIWLILVVHTERQMGCMGDVLLRLRRLSVVMLASIVGLAWPVLPSPTVRWAGLAASVVPLAGGLLWLVTKGVAKVAPLYRLHNSAPYTAIRFFYRCAHTPAGGGFWEPTTAAQCLVSFRDGMATQDTPASGSLQGMAQMITDTLTDRVVGSVLDGRAGERFRLGTHALLRRVDQGPGASIVVYSALYVDYTRYYDYGDYGYGSRDVGRHEHSAKESITVYDRKTLVPFDDGWFIASAPYDPPPQHEVAALRKAGAFTPNWLKQNKG